MEGITNGRKQKASGRCLKIIMHKCIINTLVLYFYEYFTGITGVCWSVPATVCDPGFMSGYGD